jgi:Forkhead domain
MAEGLPFAPTLIAESIGSAPLHLGLSNGDDVISEANPSVLHYKNSPYWASSQDIGKEKLKINNTTTKDFAYHHPLKQTEYAYGEDDISADQTPSFYLAEDVSPTSKHKRALRAILRRWLTTKPRYSKPSVLSQFNSSRGLLNKIQKGGDRVISRPPDIPHSTLITEALIQSPKNRLSVKNICKHIMENYKWYNDHQHGGWQVS